MNIRDNQVDEEWLECVIEDLWDLVKKVRRRSGPKRQAYILQFGSTIVDIEIRRRVPAAPKAEVNQEQQQGGCSG